MSNYHYAMSTFKSGVFGFPTEVERDEWAETEGGYAVDRHRIDPDIRREIEGRAILETLA